MVKFTSVPLFGNRIAMQASNRIGHLFKGMHLFPIFRINDEELARLCPRHNPAFLFHRQVHQGEAQYSAIGNFLLRREKHSKETDSSLSDQNLQKIKIFCQP